MAKLERPIAIAAEHIIMSMYDVMPPEGFIFKENYPDCCPYHKQIKCDSESWFEKFPYCCDLHQKLLKSHYKFDKAQFSGVVNKIVSQYAYTEFLIANAIDTLDWYEQITEYIEYNLHSFGHPRVGDHVYYNAIRHIIKVEKSIPEEKKRLLLKYFEPPKEKQESIDINILYQTYENWLKIFPFELPYFKNLEGALTKRLPILSGEISVNRYSGLAKARLATNHELIEFLFRQTQQILQLIDSTTLIKEGKISDLQKMTLDIVNENHKARQKSILLNYTKGELRYVKTIKTWLNNEKVYFKELLYASTREAVEREPTKSELLKQALINKGFSSLPKVQDLSQINQDLLIEKLASNGLPYQISMLVYLGFVDYLVNQNKLSGYALHRALGKMLSKNERDVRGNLNVLNSFSNENRNKFTAHQHKERVEKDYNLLK